MFEIGAVRATTRCSPEPKTWYATAASPAFAYDVSGISIPPLVSATERVCQHSIDEASEFAARAAANPHRLPVLERGR